MKIVPPTPTGIELAAEAIRAGQIVAYPTETVYGLGVDPFNDEAVSRLFSAKGRDTANPILLIIAEIADLESIATDISPRVWNYARTFWPGPLSLLVPKSQRLHDAITAGSPHVCVRCPSCATARALCRAVGRPITSTSANRSGEAPARSLAEIQVPEVSVGIDAGTLAASAPSTIFNPDSGQLVRLGAVSESSLCGLWDGPGHIVPPRA